MTRRRSAVLILLLAAAGAFGARLDDFALRDSMMAKGPLLGHRWLEKNGLEDYLLRQSWKPTVDSGLACVGRWSYGPSLKVSLRVTADDTIICLTRGSGASLIRFRSQDSVTLDLLGDLNFAGIPRRAVLADTLVVAGIHSGGTGLEVHGVSNPAQPNLLSRVDLPVVNDIAVKDSLVYVACEDDTLRIYNIANPRFPVLVGSCRDSCDLFMTQTGHYCYLVHVSGVNIVDVSNPASPHRAGHIGGGEPLAVCVRDTLCYVTVCQYGLRVWDISDIGAPRQVGSLPGPDALDIGIAVTCDTVLYTPTFDVISVAQPANPKLLGHVSGPGGYGVGAVPALDYCLVAAYAKGLVAMDIRNPATPTIDTSAFAAGSVVDIDVAGDRAYLASDWSGMAVLDISNPTQPSLLGRLDLPRTDVSCRSVVAGDSFAFLHWYQVPQFRSVDVSDPTRPTLAGGADVTNPPEDMVLRDSFVYVAEQSFFQVVNVARPREPVLVGSCVLQDDAEGLCLADTLAYVASYPFAIVNVKNPANPVVVGTISRGAWNGSVRDTFLFLSAGGILVYSVADPGQPRLIDSLSVGPNTFWVEAVGSLLYTGNRDGVRVIDASDVHNMRVRGFCSTPYTVRRLTYASPYIYASCYWAGVSVLESTQVGVNETTAGFRPARALVSVVPSPATGCIALTFDGYLGERTAIVVRDVTGKEVMRLNRGAASDRSVYLDVTSLASGVYYMDVTGPGRRESAKFVRR